MKTSPPSTQTEAKSTAFTRIEPVAIDTPQVKDTPPVPFRLKLTILGGSLALIPLIVVGILLLDVNARAVKVNSQELQLAILGDIARTIEETFGDASNTLDAIGRVLTDPDLDPVSTERLAASILAGQARLDHAGIYRQNGEYLDAFIEERAGDPSLPDPLPESLRSEATEQGRSFGTVEARADGPRVLIVLPLRVRSEVTGFVATRLSLVNVQERVERLHELRFEGRENALFIVDAENRFLVHPDRRKLLQSANEAVLDGLGEEAVSARFQQSGEFERQEEAMVGTVVGLGIQPWVLVAQVSESVAYASLYSMRKIVVGTIIVVLILALIVAFFVARQITQPIQELAAFAGDLAARRFNRRITVSTRDELGVLGSALSGAAADLQASEHRIREEVAIRSDLGRYLPQELVEKVVAREQDMALGGGRRNVSVLFADIVAFTPVTDRLAAEDVVGLLNELFTILSEIVFRHGGTIDKFIGDCVMAVWGAATPHQNHAAGAVAAAEDMMQWLEAGNDVWEGRYGVRLELAIGICTGDAIVGNVGSETRMEYTAIGDTVNIAARLESIARPSQVLIAASTAAAVGDAFDLRSIGQRELSGRDGTLELFEVRW